VSIGLTGTSDDLDVNDTKTGEEIYDLPNTLSKVNRGKLGTITTSSVYLESLLCSSMSLNSPNLSYLKLTVGYFVVSLLELMPESIPPTLLLRTAVKFVNVT
jgi:hypothetical protein